jgi:hypothetical protein
MTQLHGIDFDLPKIVVRCELCGKIVLLRGPLDRVRFLLSSLTTCVCGEVHDCLPNASSHSTILK